MRSLHHEFFALLDRIHHLLHDLLCRRFIIDLQRRFECHAKLYTPLLELQPLFIKGPPESPDHNRDHYRPVLFDDQRRTLPARRKCLGRPLRERDHPTALQRPRDLSRIGGVQTLPPLRTFFIPGPANRQRPRHRKKPAHPGGPHRLLRSHIIYIRERVQ